MAESDGNIDPKSGFNPQTRIFHSLRPRLDLPLENSPTVAAYALSLRANSPWPDAGAFINSTTGQRLTYSEFTHRTKSLAFYLRTVVRLSKGDTAFVLSSNSVQLPILYFSLLSIGVVVSPANPLSTVPEISHQIKISNPVIAFATSSSAHKLPKLRHQTILIDSSEFDSMTRSTINQGEAEIEVSQDDSAAIMYSSGTTGRVKGVVLTHRNLIAIVASYYASRGEGYPPAVVLITLPLFLMIGFFYVLRSVALSETLVVMERFDARKMMKAVEDFRVTHTVLAPPVVVAMVKSELADGFDLSSLVVAGTGGAPLGKDVISAFTRRYPHVMLVQGYGLTEGAGTTSGCVSLEECLRWGTVGKLSAEYEAKIVDPDTGEALPPGKRGELWIRGPTIMKGYAGDPEATSATLTKDGWLKTGDICYIDEEGFLYVVDRLKELIKYKGYQVAPAELEQLLLSHPEITEAAVIPYPDEEAGQLPMAFVVRKHGSNLSEAEVLDFVAKQVAPYKKVRRMAFVNSIPKTPTGKILRKDLRKIALPEPSSKL